MFRNTENTTATTRKTGRFTKARKLLLGLGGLAVAGVMMGASQAQARDRFDHHDRGFERHEFRHDVVVRDYVDPVIVCDPVIPAPAPEVWVPDQFELITHWHHGRPFTERVLVQPGHWVCQ